MRRVWRLASECTALVGGTLQEAAVIGRVCRRGAGARSRAALTSRGGFEFMFIFFSAIIELYNPGRNICFTLASFKLRGNVAPGVSMLGKTKN